MKQKRALVVFVLLGLLISMVGCGGSKTSNTPEKTSKENPAVVQMDAQKATLMVDVQWLKDNLDKVDVIDARVEKDYTNGHIPGAVNATWQSLCDMQGKPGEVGWGVALPQEELAAKIGALGISGEKPVIVYAQPPGWGEEGCVLWMLKMAGIKDAKMLDGGYAVWQTAGNETSKDVVKATAVPFKIDNVDESLTASTDFINKNLGKIRIVDSRSEKEYKGATDYGEARGGHLPGAINIPFESMFNQDNTLKDFDQLSQIFQDAGLKPGDEIVTYCTAGIRSGYMALVMRAAGYENARNYDESFYEWAGNKSLKVEK
ncbi:MAG: sulfurtransferase [Syntrophomonadaceae bacterium]|nr:sulfurtransferase [Syntrophomonadaceae bacterium]